MLPRLNQSLIRTGSFPAGLSVPNYDAQHLPTKVLQIGEGVFMRAFVDVLIHRLNQAKRFNSNVVIAQPRAGGHARKLNEQDGLFTVILRGQAGGELIEEKEIVGCVREGIDPYTQHDKFIERAHDRNLRFVFSNTTEAGIALTDTDRLEDKPATSFPAKMTQLLLERWKHFDADPAAGLIFIPCELIERNGDTLKRLILQTAEKWKVSQAFSAWVRSANIFTNTLVDRIVTGSPTDEAEALCTSLGYTDTHLDAAEPYMAWIIEAPSVVRDEFPVHEVGLNVTWTQDVTPFRERKVRILNGGHTLMTPVGLLAGLETVKNVTDDTELAAFLRGGLFEEILPTINQPKAELEKFAADTLDRFANPFIKHKLASIALNSVSKFKARLLPAMIESTQNSGIAPRRITLALAALITLYQHSNAIQDDAAAIARIRAGGPVEALFADDGLWPIERSVREIIAESVESHLTTLRGDAASAERFEGVVSVALSQRMRLAVERLSRS